MREERQTGKEGGSGPAEEGSIFSIFEEKTKPPPPPKPVSAQPKPAAAQPVPRPEPPKPDVVDLLQKKVADLEKKLSESQERGLSFAYELKGREEARKESRREMEEFLAAVKQQQAAAEAEKSHGLELEKARARIEALEQKLLENNASSARENGLSALEQKISDLAAASEARAREAELKIAELAGSRKTALAGLNEGELEKLRAGLRGDMASVFTALSAELVQRLAGESSARVAALEEAARKMYAALEASAAGEAGSRAELAALAERMHAESGDIRRGLAELGDASSSLRNSLGAISAGAAGAAQWTTESAGRDAADQAARRLLAAAGSYDMGFILGSLDNLERTLASAVETLGRVRSDAQGAAGDPGWSAEMRVRRHISMLESLAHDLEAGLTAFRGVRAGMMEPIKRILKS